jgi:hypothetical protein
MAGLYPHIFYNVTLYKDHNKGVVSRLEGLLVLLIEGLKSSARNIFAIVISAWMFHHGNISSHAPFCTTAFRQMDFSTPERFDMGNFSHEEFSAPEHFSTGIFRHLNMNMDILAPCKAI